MAKYLGVHSDAIYDLVRAGKIPHVRVGKNMVDYFGEAAEWPTGVVELGFWEV